MAKITQQSKFFKLFFYPKSEIIDQNQVYLDTYIPLDTRQNMNNTPTPPPLSGLIKVITQQKRNVCLQGVYIHISICNFNSLITKNHKILILIYCQQRNIFLDDATKLMFVFVEKKKRKKNPNLSSDPYKKIHLDPQTCMKNLSFKI